LVRLHPDIANIADKFIRVRLVKIAGMDLRRFEFDYDLTWFVFFLNADETIYGRYGGRDASDAEGRISTKGLRYAMDRALEKHKSPPAPQELIGRPILAEDSRPAKNHKGCIHCHNINEFRRAESKAAGTWNRESLWVYPLPDNLGIKLDIHEGDRVSELVKDSAAEQTGLRVGDRIVSLNGHTVDSFADATYALHKAPKSGTIPIRWQRGDRELDGTLKLTDGWRKTNLSWRPSLLDILPSIPLNGEDLTPAEKAQLGLDPKQATLKQDPIVHASLETAGLRGGDVIIGFDEKTFTGDRETLYSHIRRNHLVGDVVTLNVLRNGKKVDLKLTLK
jgi:hypothetical protein